MTKISVVDQDNNVVGQIELQLIEEAYKDEHGVIWTRPTAWAYMQSCRALSKARERIRELEGASVQEVEALPEWRCTNCKYVASAYLKPDRCPNCNWCTCLVEVATPTPSRITPTPHEILELAREDWATIWFDNPATQERIIEGAWDQDTPITSRVSVLTEAVKRGWGK